MTIYAKAGERITCENGHPIGIFNRNVFVHEPIAARAIAWLIEPVPQEGDPLTPCSCGANYIRQTPYGGFQAHIGGQWRAVWNG